MEIKHQQQPTFDSCMVTSCAMLVGADADELYGEWHQKFKYGAAWLDDLLDHYGFSYFYGSPRKGALQWGFAYLLTVPSLNIEGGLHQILVVTSKAADGIRIYDPCMGREGAKYYGWSEHFLNSKDENPLARSLKSWVIDLIIPVDQ